MLATRPLHERSLPLSRRETLKNSVLRALLYFDLFDFSPTIEEIHRYLEEPATRQDILESLMAHPRIIVQGSYFALEGREGLFPIRRSRLSQSSNLWQKSLPWLRLTQAIPFLRFVGVSGSLAVNNAYSKADVDIVFIAEPKFLRISFLFFSLLKKICRRHVALCPNLGLERHHLTISNRSLYAAHEIFQVTPIWGEGAFENFLQANEWASSCLPNAPLSKRPMLMSESRALAMWRVTLESLLIAFKTFSQMIARAHQWHLGQQPLGCPRINCYQQRNRPACTHGTHEITTDYRYSRHLKKYF